MKELSIRLRDILRVCLNEGYFSAFFKNPLANGSIIKVQTRNSKIIISIEHDYRYPVLSKPDNQLLFVCLSPEATS